MEKAKNTSRRFVPYVGVTNHTNLIKGFTNSMYFLIISIAGRFLLLWVRGNLRNFCFFLFWGRTKPSTFNKVASWYRSNTQRICTEFMLERRMQGTRRPSNNNK